MTSYAPSSSLGWLDLDVSASERVATMLRALDEPGTLDVLGLGTIRDAFSELLAPGTSTIQTRLRYFLFLPWIFQQLAADAVDPGSAAARLRDREKLLIARLVHLGPNQGVIGFNARDRLKRMPSEAYWGGLGSWGIRRFDLTISEYARYTVTASARRPDRDDDGNVTHKDPSPWAQLPEAPDGFMIEDADFDLTTAEAEFLLDHVRQRHPDSLIARYAGSGVDVNVDYPWNLPRGPATPRLLEVLRHAENFSELTTGPQYVYNLLLAREAQERLGRNTDQLIDAQSELLQDWADAIAQRGDELAEWVDNLDELWLMVGGDEIHPRTKEFVGDMLRRAMTNPSGLAKDRYVATRIGERESHLKGKRARLANRSALENWNGAPFGGPFVYRWGTVVSYLADLNDAIVEMA